MKKFGAILVSAIILSCSVEDDFLPVGDALQDISAVVEIEGGETISYPFEEAGVIEVINDNEFIYISVSAKNGYELNRVRFHLAGELSDFPVRGNGALPQGQMEYDMKFSPAVNNYTFKFPVSDYSENITIASFSEFLMGSEKVHTWAGDQYEKNGNWYYFNYTIQEYVDPCENFDAGPDNSREISQSVIPDLETYQVLNLYKSLLDDSVPEDGTFDPSIRSLIDLYKSRDDDEKLGDYTTTYTITEGECTDSVELTLTVVSAVVFDPCENFDAGPDNSREISQSVIPNLETYQVINLYKSLLDASVPEDGTFNPSIRSLIDLYKSRDDDEKLGDYTTTYTITEGECTDSVELTLTVVSAVVFDPCENFDAGPDNSREISQSVIPTLETYQVINLYKSLLDASVPEDGTFNPSIRSLIDLYKSRQGDEKLGDYTTTYTITEGECTDSVELTIRVVPD
ncbi:hypothetical protein [Salegentibacter sediminis]|uniref:hypothetical protein n=1 Tax=Salegentibacter sediminis TaxID=1930251 RepID=UPI0009C0EF51|nr:hypothetical protein [Salegentibacter sediminis]